MDPGGSFGRDAGDFWKCLGKVEVARGLCGFIVLTNMARANDRTNRHSESLDFKWFTGFSLTGEVLGGMMWG